jgi:hypothetical protein
MIELAPVAIIVLRGPGLQVEAFNPHAVELFATQEVIGHTVDEVFPDTEQTGFVKLIREAYRADETRQFARQQPNVDDTNRQATQSTFAFTIIPAHDSAGKVAGIIIYGDNAAAEGR